MKGIWWFCLSDEPEGRGSLEGLALCAVIWVPANGLCLLCALTFQPTVTENNMLHIRLNPQPCHPCSGSCRRRVIHSCIRGKKTHKFSELFRWQPDPRLAEHERQTRSWKGYFLGSGGETLGTWTRQSDRVRRSMWRQVEDTFLCQHAESPHGFRLLSWSPKSLSQ